MSKIARSLGRAPSTVTREVAANGGIGGYGAMDGLPLGGDAAIRPGDPSPPSLTMGPWSLR